MPPKVRDIIADLEKAGFVNRGGKGSHRNFVHPRVAEPLPYRASWVPIQKSIRSGQ
jgi:predicted RNA binding protein YcfA (HicA-like mRNA interferase family)